MGEGNEQTPIAVIEDIDFIDFKIWPVFNIADSSITIGAVILVWVIFFKKNEKV